MNTALAIVILFFINVFTLVALLVAVFAREKSERKYTDLKSYLKSRDEFNAMVVHELRTPLSLMNGATDTILRHKDLKREILEDLIVSIRDSSSGMLELVTALLDYAKIEAGKFVIHKETNDLEAALKQAVVRFQPLAEAKNLTLSYQEAAIPTFAFDQMRIQQVVNNLVSNALKFTDQGSVTIAVKKEDHQVIVSVQDTGRGIKSQELNELFTDFKQLSSAKDTLGTGLGLVVTKGIVEAHGGKIGVESVENEGSTFFFSLPLTV